MLSCFRLAGRSNHSRSTHFDPAGGATRRPDFEDRILGPKCSPYSGTACPAPRSGVPGTRPQIVGCFLGPKSGTQNEASRGWVRQRFSCPVSRRKSSSSTPTPTSFHTRRRRCLDRRPHQTIMKRQCVPHAEAHTSISNSPKRRQQAESRKQPARGLSKQAAGNKQTTAGSRESA